MLKTLADAISALRRFHDWSQEELAREISRHAPRGTPAPDQPRVSEWEHRVKAPSSPHRIALARIAASFKATEDLAPLFLAGRESWKVVSRVRLLDERRRTASRGEDGIK
jgi:transcriptional regulator with XRE-family HTH domain